MPWDVARPAGPLLHRDRPVGRARSRRSRGGVGADAGPRLCRARLRPDRRGPRPARRRRPRPGRRFRPRALVVVTTTGSGWVDPGAVDSVEYLVGGDTPTVAMQYSYLPSWMSYLVDQARAREAGRELFDAVYDRWSKLPARRPAAPRRRRREPGLLRRRDGIQRRVRPPQPHRRRRLRRAAELQHALPRVRRRARRRQPEVAPEYRGGRTVRFTDDPQSGVAARRTARGTGPRVLYLQHPSDPIVWWSPQLMSAPAGLARGAARRRRRRRDALDPLRHLLAGDGRPARSPSTCPTGTGTSTPTSTSTPGPGSSARRLDGGATPRLSERSSRLPAEPVPDRGRRDRSHTSGVAHRPQ